MEKNVDQELVLAKTYGNDSLFYMMEDERITVKEIGGDVLLQGVIIPMFMRFCQLNKLGSTHFSNANFVKVFWDVIEAGYK